MLRQPQAGAANQDASTLMKIQVGGAKRPFFFMHGRWLSGGAYCWRISEALGPGQPFYALQPVELPEARHSPTIEAVAARYVALIRAVDPEGPYLLGGYCNGGVIAYEMARQLIAQGSQVNMLFLIDAELLPARLRLARMCISVLGRWSRVGAAKQLQAFTWLRLAYIQAKSAIRTFPQRVRHRIVSNQPGSNVLNHVASAQRDMNDDARTALDAAGLRTLAMHEWIIAGYKPRPSQAPVTLVWSSEEANASRSMWAKVAHVLATHIIPGDHVTCLSEHLDVLNAHLAACLNSVQGAPLKAKACEGSDSTVNGGSVEGDRQRR
jgi:thioesterase domain-containing protein